MFSVSDYLFACWIICFFTNLVVLCLFLIVLVMV